MVKVDIENIIASAKISESLDLSRIAESIEGAEYNPDRFPGVVLRFESPRIVVLLFDKGRIMCTGGRSVKDVQSVMDNIYKTLEDLKLLGEPVKEEGDKKKGKEAPKEEKKSADDIDVGMTSLPPEVEAELMARGPPEEEKKGGDKKPEK